MFYFFIKIFNSFSDHMNRRNTMHSILFFETSTPPRRRFNNDNQKHFTQINYNDYISFSDILIY